MRDYLELTKPRITLLILICTAVGYWFGCGASFHGTILAHALLGTALLASGTSALNQWYEADSNAKMRRTRRRPLPAGRIKRGHALAFGLMLSAAGFAELWVRHESAGGRTSVCSRLPSYLLLYTPLKQRSHGMHHRGRDPRRYAAPYRLRGSGPWPRPCAPMALFLILFVWQFPHFDAIAWMYRDDYARGGIRMLPSSIGMANLAARRVVVCSLLLIPISLVPLFLGMTGELYAAAAIAAGLGMLYFGARLGRERTLARAHALLLATVFYLPALLGVMVLDRRVL